MQESTIKRRPYAGVLLCILITAIFLAVDTALSTLLSPHIYGAQWSVISSVVRLLFGIIVLIVDCNKADSHRRKLLVNVTSDLNVVSAKSR